MTQISKAFQVYLAKSVFEDIIQRSKKSGYTDC